jgi:DNA-binding response OmpR family regulator
MELDQMKSRFLTNITHEFRTPLTIIQGLATHITQQQKIKDGIQRNSFNLLNLVNQMLDLAKLEAGNMPLNLQRGNIISYLSYIVESFQSLAASKQIRLHFLPKTEQLDMDYDADKLMKIMANLLSNAIRFTQNGGNVYVVIEKLETGKQLSIKVKDTGIGIAEKELPHIFDRFYQVDASITRKGEGSGIGLAYSKELAKILKGALQVDSILHQGSIFTLLLPINRNAAPKPLTKEEIPRAFTDVPHQLEKSVEIIDASLDSPTVLVVEDNLDVKEYLRICLEDKYQLTYAENGVEGIKKAIEIIPDIIISDVMMPEKDGFQLCETLKNDHHTSHIPIVLLTAKADVESKLSGLQKGADAYMSKPFNQKELLIRVQQLIALRSVLQKRYAKALPVVEEKKVNIPKEMADKFEIEDVFLNKVNAIIMAHIDDEDFNSTLLCQKIGMSNSQLYRKLKAITNKSIAIYIRSVRLQKAHILLFTTELNISEIAHQVGFKDVTYFSRCFSEEFGQPPSQLRKIPPKE